MSEALDAQTWTIVIGVVLGFFAVPGAMLVHDLRRQRRERAARRAVLPAQPRQDGGRRDVAVPPSKRRFRSAYAPTRPTPRPTLGGHMPAPPDIDVPDRP